MDVGVFQETKLADGIYTWGSAGYRVVATLAPSRHRGGFTILYWDSPNFAVKAIHQFGVNIIACELVTKEWCWYILGCYLAPGDGVTIWNMEAAMAERPGGEGQS